jgi:hypothetical protein
MLRSTVWLVAAVARYMRADRGLMGLCGLHGLTWFAVCAVLSAVPADAPLQSGGGNRGSKEGHGPILQVRLLTLLVFTESHLTLV